MAGCVWETITDIRDNLKAKEVIVIGRLLMGTVSPPNGKDWLLGSKSI